MRKTAAAEGINLSMWQQYNGHPSTDHRSYMSGLDFFDAQHPGKATEVVETDADSRETTRSVNLCGEDVQSCNFRFDFEEEAIPDPDNGESGENLDSSAHSIYLETEATDHTGETECADVDEMSIKAIGENGADNHTMDPLPPERCTEMQDTVPSKCDSREKECPPKNLCPYGRNCCLGKRCSYYHPPSAGRKDPYEVMNSIEKIKV